MKKTLTLVLLVILASTWPASAASPALSGGAQDSLPAQGGNRLYWNTIREPRSLEMRGATWQDPALVPPLPNTPTLPKATKAPKKAARPQERAAAAQPSGKTQQPATKEQRESSGIPPLVAPNPHDEDLAQRHFKPFDPFAKSEPVPASRLQ